MYSPCHISYPVFFYDILCLRTLHEQTLEVDYISKQASFRYSECKIMFSFFFFFYLKILLDQSQFWGATGTEFGWLCYPWVSKSGWIVACILLSLVCNDPQSHLWLPGPGIEPGSLTQEASTIPLHQATTKWCCFKPFMGSPYFHCTFHSKRESDVASEWGHDTF